MSRKLTTNGGCPVVDKQHVTTTGKRGAAGAERDNRGFALKFYTE